MTQTPHLELDAVRAFLRIAELGSFTLAAESLQTTQSAISAKLKRLEARLGCRLVERTPRHVALSSHGVTFLDSARMLIEAHDRAVTAVAGARKRLAIGISDHVAGPELPALIARVNAQDPSLIIEVRIGSSAELLQAYDRREFNVVLARFDHGRDDGRVLAEEPFGWFAAPGWQPRAGQPLPVATMADPCGVRMLSSQLLDAAEVPWIEVFVGGGVATVVAAVMAGLGVAALARRMLPLGAVEVGERLGLPALPRLPVMMHARRLSGAPGRAVEAIAAAFEGMSAFEVNCR